MICALEQAGYAPDAICGTSFGALVGTIHAQGTWIGWRNGRLSSPGRAW
ncbi:hypothetical protein [Ottowia caeni]